MHSTIERLKQGQRTRIVGFGSSNTERSTQCRGRLNWLDWLDYGLAIAYGRHHFTINAGIGGDTTRGLLARFDEDCALYQPHLVFVTIGGNDAGVNYAMPHDEFRGNLLRLSELIGSLPECRLAFQTYYSFDLDNYDAVAGKRFLEFMDIVRDVAAQTGSLLVDHLARWEPLRLRDVEHFRRLMTDPCHVNPAGNLLMGLDLIRLFGGQLDEPTRQDCAEGHRLQALVDGLQSAL